MDGGSALRLLGRICEARPRPLAQTTATGRQFARGEDCLKKGLFHGEDVETETSPAALGIFAPPERITTAPTIDHLRRHEDRITVEAAHHDGNVWRPERVVVIGGNLLHVGGFTTRNSPSDRAWVTNSPQSSKTSHAPHSGQVENGCVITLTRHFNFP